MIICDGRRGVGTGPPMGNAKGNYPPTGAFPSDETLLKLFYLALRNISTQWTMPTGEWKAALNRFTIQFEDRMPQH